MVLKNYTKIESTGNFLNFVPTFLYFTYQQNNYSGDPDIIISERFIVPLWEFYNDFNGLLTNQAGDLKSAILYQIIDTTVSISLNVGGTLGDYADNTYNSVSGGTTILLFQAYTNGNTYQKNYKVGVVPDRPAGYYETTPTTVLSSYSIVTSSDSGINNLQFRFSAYIANNNNINIISGFSGSGTFIRLALESANLTETVESARFFFSWVRKFTSDSYLITGGATNTFEDIVFKNTSLNKFYGIPEDASVKLLKSTTLTVTNFNTYFSGLTTKYLLLPIFQNNPATVNGYGELISGDYFSITGVTAGNSYPPYQIYYNAFGDLTVFDQNPYFYQIDEKTYFDKIDDIPFYLAGRGGFPLLSNNEPVVPCLLKGTKILTPDGYKAIESLINSDIILNHINRPVPIVKISNRKIKWRENLSDDKKIFKIDGAEPIYLTGYHKVRLEDGTFQEAHNCYLPYAKKEEYVDETDCFEIFHIHVDDWSNNHLIVNGGKVVESWSGEYNNQ